MEIVVSEEEKFKLERENNSDFTIKNCKKMFGVQNKKILEYKHIIKESPRIMLYYKMK